jgi:hypothetical protein
VTDDFPADHRHQRGVFFAWTQTRLVLDGKTLTPDFWNLGSGTGRIRSLAAHPLRIRQGAGIRAEHVWEARRDDEWVPVMREFWTVRLLPARDGAGWWGFDLRSRQLPLLTLELPEYRYGGMAVRGAADWNRREAPWVVATASGKDRGSADGSRERWIAMSGPIAGRPAGIACLEHPGNPGAPSALRLHPDVPYFAHSLPRGGASVLPANRRADFNYRLLVFNDRPDAAVLNREWTAFAEGR